MKIAVPFENGEVFQHFGHCETFKIYEVENGVTVTACDGTSITFDANHEMAGKDLNFHIELVEVSE